jgi:hypothetical protein
LQVHGGALYLLTCPSSTLRSVFSKSFCLIVPLISAQYRKIRISSEDSSYTHHLKRKYDENEDTTLDEMSQTQEDSQGLFYAFTHHAYITITPTVYL